MKPYPNEELERMSKHEIIRLYKRTVEQFNNAVPVIRCKDCKYYRADGDCWHERENDRWIYYQSVINEPNPDDYCSLAERKEE